MPRADGGQAAPTRLDDSGASDFEEVPMQASDSASSSDGEGLSDEELDNLDDQVSAVCPVAGFKSDGPPLPHMPERHCCGSLSCNCGCLPMFRTACQAAKLAANALQFQVTALGQCINHGMV